MKTIINLSKLGLFLVAAIFAGCAVEAGDDSAETATAEEAANWGGPGFPIPPGLTVEPGDVVEKFLYRCSVKASASDATKRVASHECTLEASRECTLDGGVVTSATPSLQCFAGQANCTIVVGVRCLHKADAS
jgi:hypothetical protein